MLEKLRENPRLVVAGLLTLGVLVLALGGDGQNDNNGDTPADSPESSQTEEQVDESSAENGESEPSEAIDTQPSSLNEVLGTAPLAGAVQITKSADSYSAVARAGDNQTLVVRQIVEDYISEQGETLTIEQKLYVETNVVDTLPRDDLIHVGEEVAVAANVLDQYVTLSQGLSEAETLAWANCL